MLGFKNFHRARVILGGIEVMHMIRKGQVKCAGKDPSSASQQFYSLVS
ncbi:transposase-like protein [Paraburkholderia sp. JPY419]